MKANKEIDIEKDWKVLTLLIGANNLCDSCNPEMDKYDAADAFKASLSQVVKEVYYIIDLIQVDNHT